MNGLARLKPGVTLDDAARDSDPHVRGTDRSDRKHARIVRLVDQQQESSRLPLWVLLGAASLLLLISCANIAGLLLGDAESRRHEIAVRAALGGSRLQITRLLFGETLALAVAAACLGVVLAAWFTPALTALAPTALPRIGDVGIDLRVCAFAALVSIATAVLFGTTPVLALASADPASCLREGGRDAGLRRRYAQRFIVAGEVALAVVLLAAASLLGESLFRLTSQPVGFNPDNLVVVNPRLVPEPGATPERRVARTDALLSALAALPGTTAVAATSTAPFSGSSGSNSIQIEGKTFDRDPPSNRHIVTDRYFHALRIPIVKGRGFEATDLPGGHVAVVTQEFERRYMDGEAVGKRFTLNNDLHTVVGVVPLTKHREYNDEAGPAFYALSRQLPTWGLPHFIIRTSTAPEAAIPMLRKAIETAEPLSAIITIETMADMMRRSVAEERFRAQLSMIFGGAALVLAALGLYGLVARSVADRRREIGVRIALGAQPGNVLRLILGQGITLVGGGLVVGVPAALAASQLAASLLYGVTPTSPHTFAAVAGVLGLVALVATIIPARRASRIDPIKVLRS